MDTRIKAGVPTSVLDFRRMMADERVYRNDVVFGMFNGEELRNFAVVRPMQNGWSYMFINMMSRRDGKARLKKGYNPETQALLDNVVRDMEEAGHYVIYSCRPATKHWFKTEENEDRLVKDEYTTEIIEIVQADMPATSAIGKLLMSRINDYETEVIVRRRRKGRVQHQPGSSQ